MCVLSILFVIASIGNDLKINMAMCVCVRALWNINSVLRPYSIRMWLIFPLFMCVCVCLNDNTPFTIIELFIQIKQVAFSYDLCQCSMK